MATSVLLSVLIGTGLCLLLFLALLPSLWILDPVTFQKRSRQPRTWGNVALIVVGAGVALGAFLVFIQEPSQLVFWGRLFGALLQVALLGAVFVGILGLLLLFWPRGGAVALAAFREGLRQPLFWMLFLAAVVLMVLSPFIPYFTFGEDFKMVQELGYDAIMLLSTLFAVLAASISISEEIEGRTAITLMSKPVSRRQFLLGKFYGILLAALVMITLLGVFFTFILWFKPWFDKEPPPDPIWMYYARLNFAGLGEVPLNFLLGVGYWFAEAGAIAPGLILGFCKMMVLLAIAVALATRLPFIVNVVICLIIFFLGHLTQILVQVSEGKFKLVNVMAQIFDNLLPGLNAFDVGPLIMQPVPPPPLELAIYVGWGFVYAAFYTAIALLLGLFLFEDRDLA